MFFDPFKCTCLSVCCYNEPEACVCVYACLGIRVSCFKKLFVSEGHNVNRIYTCVI